MDKISILEGFYFTERTDETKSEYINRARQLISRAKKELNFNADEELDVRQFVVWLVEIKPTLSRSTWRQYKSAVVYYLEQYEFQDIAIEALEYIKNITSEGALKQTDKTSSLKLKKIPIEDWLKLDEFLKSSDLKWHSQLRDWLRASILTGLRPVEWKGSFLVDNDGMTCLKVPNAKNTNGRSHGEYRTLVLENMSTEDMRAIKSHLNNIRMFLGMEEYEYFYRGCAISLYKTCRKLWPRRKKHITLYSTRHQFSANAKSSGLSKVEVAALMGHAVDITATMHYGRKTAGNEEIGVSPIDAEVAKIRQIDKTDENILNRKTEN